MHAYAASPPRPPVPSSSRHPPREASQHHQYYQQQQQQQQMPDPQRGSLRTAQSAPRLRRRDSREEMPPPPLPSSSSRSRAGAKLVSAGRPQDRAGGYGTDERMRGPEGEGKENRPSPSSSSSGGPWARTPRRAYSDDPPTLSSTMARSSSLTKVDSGYAPSLPSSSSATLSTSTSSSSIGSAAEAALGAAGVAGARVKEGWRGLVGAYENYAAAPASREGGGGEGAQLWNRLTTAASASVARAQVAFSSLTLESADEDGAVGADGETKLSRAIKEFHLSRCATASDVPDWVLSPAELASRERRSSASPASAPLSRPSQPTFEPLPSRAPPQSWEERQETSTSELGERVSPRKGSAADRLRQMREEKRRGGGR